jgi:mono/diheme cytochrome c family protein
VGSKLPRLTILPLATMAVLQVIASAANASDISAYANQIYTGRYPQQKGEDLYRAICQGCHMPNARGAVGAGAYPSLVNNPRLRSAAYALSVVANGQKAMPWFGGPLTDTQIAEVVGYVRTHFGNHYSAHVTAADVKAVRRPAPTPGD